MIVQLITNWMEIFHLYERVSTHCYISHPRFVFTFLMMHYTAYIQIATRLKFTNIHPSMCGILIFVRQCYSIFQNKNENLIEIDRHGLINCKRSELSIELNGVADAYCTLDFVRITNSLSNDHIACASLN